MHDNKVKCGCIGDMREDIEITDPSTNQEGIHVVCMHDNNVKCDCIGDMRKDIEITDPAGKYM